MKVTRDWRRINVEVTADGEGLVSHAGTALLVQVADETGLTRALSRELRVLQLRAGSHDRGVVVRDLAVMLVDGGDCLADLRAVREQAALFAETASGSTAFRVIDQIARHPEAMSSGGGESSAGGILPQRRVVRWREVASYPRRELGVLHVSRVALDRAPCSQGREQAQANTRSVVSFSSATPGRTGTAARPSYSTSFSRTTRRCGSARGTSASAIASPRDRQGAGDFPGGRRAGDPGAADEPGSRRNRR